MAEEVDIQMRGSPPEDIEKIQAMLKQQQEEINKLKKPVDQPMTDKTAEIEELEKYRERDRQEILSGFSKELQEEYQNSPLEDLKKIQKLQKNFEKKNVGQEPPITSAEPERPHSWCYKCRKNHSGPCD